MPMSFTRWEPAWQAPSNPDNDFPLFPFFIYSPHIRWSFAEVIFKIRNHFSKSFSHQIHAFSYFPHFHLEILKEKLTWSHRESKLDQLDDKWKANLFSSLRFSHGIVFQTLPIPNLNILTKNKIGKWNQTLCIDPNLRWFYTDGILFSLEIIFV